MNCKRCHGDGEEPGAPTGNGEFALCSRCQGSGTEPGEAPAGVPVYAVALFNALRRIQVESSPDAEADAEQLRRQLLAVNRQATEALSILK
jgi:hypothetical protein